MSSSNNQFRAVHDQNFFQLACILSAPMGLSSVIVEELANKYGAGTAISSIFLGNLILWLIALSIISMASQYRIDAIQNVREYLGKYGALLTALILIFAFLNWFVHHINTSVTILRNIFDFDSYGGKDLIVRLGAALGFFSALLVIGGIRFLKWMAVISLPGLFCYHLYAIFVSDYSIPSQEGLGLSFFGIISAMLILLPGVINLPTFFRHSRSRADSYLALTLLTIFITFFEISSIWIRFSNFKQVFSQTGSYLIFFSGITAICIILTLTLANLLNIYFASAAWATFIPRFEGAKGHSIIGLLGTAAYTFIQISSPIYFFEDLANAYIATLGIVMLISFLIRLIVRHRPRTFEKTINGLSWLFGCAVATFLEIQNHDQGVYALLSGVCASSLFFLAIIFIEETVWSARKILADK